jgi:endonuclease YncB( thermonuclease family)
MASPELSSARIPHEPVIVRGYARVTDGDTFVVGASKQRVRLKAMDAFETKQLCRDAQGVEFSCGIVATNRMIKLVGGREVECIGTELDQYGRLVGVCSVGGVDLNGKLVEEGA